MIRDKITQGINNSMLNLTNHHRRAIKSSVNNIIVRNIKPAYYLFRITMKRS